MKTSIKTIGLQAVPATGLTSPLFSQVPDLTIGTQSVDRNLAATPTPPVSDGLLCWFDAGVGGAWDNNGVAQAWQDLSGNDNFATSTAGAPRLVENQLDAKPAIQFRTSVKNITYIKEMSWSQDRLLNGANGIAALTFCEAPVTVP